MNLPCFAQLLLTVLPFALRRRLARVFVSVLFRHLVLRPFPILAGYQIIDPPLEIAQPALPPARLSSAITYGCGDRCWRDREPLFCLNRPDELAVVAEHHPG